METVSFWQPILATPQGDGVGWLVILGIVVIIVLWKFTKFRGARTRAIQYARMAAEEIKSLPHPTSNDILESRAQYIARFEKEDTIRWHYNSLIVGDGIAQEDAADILRTFTGGIAHHDVHHLDHLRISLVADYLARGDGHRAKGKDDLAIADFSKAIELDPKNTDAYTRRAAAYAAKGDHARALADFTTVIELDPKSARAYLDRAAAYRQNDDLDKAIADYSRAITLAPQSAEVYLERGSVYWAMYFRARSDQPASNEKAHCRDLAMADFSKAIELDPKNADAYDRRAAAYRDLGDHDRAFAEHTKLIEANPESAEGHYRRGFGYYLAKQYAKAIPDMERWKVLTGKTDLDVFISTCRHELAHGPAIAECNKAIELNPASAEAYTKRGSMHKGHGDYKLAIADFTKVVELDPESARAYMNRAASHASNRAMDNAIADYTKAIELNPQLAEAYMERASVYGRWAVYGETKISSDLEIADLSKAIELNPELVEAYCRRGCAYLCAHQYAMALVDLERYQGRTGKTDLADSINTCREMLAKAPDTGGFRDCPARK